VTYAVGDTRSFGGRIYLSLQAANLNHQPDTSGTYWRRVSLDGWQYVYTLPSDCVRVIEVWSGANDPRDSESVASRIGYDPSLGKLLFLNWQNPDLRYTARVDSPVLYPPEFVDAFAWELSDDLAQTLKGDAQLAALNPARPPTPRSCARSRCPCRKRSRDSSRTPCSSPRGPRGSAWR
jgi:hypothetical protein